MPFCIHTQWDLYFSAPFMCRQLIWFFFVLLQTVDSLYPVNTLSHLNRSLSHFSFVIKPFSSTACTCGGIKLTIVNQHHFHPIIKMSYANHFPKKISEIPCWHFSILSGENHTVRISEKPENQVKIIRYGRKQSHHSRQHKHNITFFSRLNRNESNGCVAVTGQSKRGDLI